MKKRDQPSPGAKRISSTLLLLGIHPCFEKDITKLRTLFGVPTNGFDDPKNERPARHKDWLEGVMFWDDSRNNRETKSRNFRRAISRLLERYGLGENYRGSIVSYFLFGDFMSAFTQTSNYSIIVPSPGGIRSPYLAPDALAAIQIHASLTKPERKAAMQMANKLIARGGTERGDSKKSLRAFDDYVRVAGLHGKTSMEIVASIWSNATDQRPKTDKKRAAKVRKWRQRLRELTRRRFPRDTFGPC